jgi:hypothetical protein
MHSHCRTLLATISHPNRRPVFNLESWRSFFASSRLGVAPLVIHPIALPDPATVAHADPASRGRTEPGADYTSRPKTDSLLEWRPAGIALISRSRHTNPARIPIGVNADWYYILGSEVPR